jgi:PAS domain S-box-containing protein
VLVLDRPDTVLLDPLMLGLLRAVGDLVAAALARRRAEEAARRADDRYRRLLDTSAEGVCLLAADGTIASANRSFATLVGLPPSALQGLPIRGFLPQTDREATALAARLLHETTRFDVELQAVDGSRHWVSCATSALRDDVDGALALVMMTDISVRRAAEAALRNSEARFRALVRSSNDVILVTDDRGAVAYASPAVRDVLGHEPATLLGRSPLEFVHPDDLADVRERAATLWQDRVGSLVLRCRVVTSSDGYRTMEAALTNLIDDEAVAGIRITARDISEQVELHASLAHDASHDPVTGLPNRRVFERRLHEALRSGPGPGRVAVLFGDLDGF